MHCYKHVNGTDSIIFHDDGNHTFTGKQANDLMFKIQRLCRDNSLNMFDDFDCALIKYLYKCHNKKKMWLKQVIENE